MFIERLPRLQRVPINPSPSFSLAGTCQNQVANTSIMLLTKLQTLLRLRQFCH